MPHHTLPLDDEGMYHIYNRAAGKETLFQNVNQYRHFLTNVEKYLLPQVSIWSYCLMPNHFHFLIEIQEHSSAAALSKAISDCCNAYTKWFNLVTHRKGNLFMRPFKRNKIESDAHLAWIIWYIHRNPLHHHYAQALDEWQYSSYKAIMNPSTKVARQKVLQFFGSSDTYQHFHTRQQSGWYNSLEDF